MALGTFSVFFTWINKCFDVKRKILRVQSKALYSFDQCTENFHPDPPNLFETDASDPPEPEPSYPDPPDSPDPSQ